ncbi:MAG: hypothetical protein QNK37_08060 [Acidobacteriota bacterium]|nr:hypothetical protein [Acidobacteriota bacterium]
MNQNTAICKKKVDMIQNAVVRNQDIDLASVLIQFDQGIFTFNGVPGNLQRGDELMIQTTNPVTITANSDDFEVYENEQWQPFTETTLRPLIPLLLRVNKEDLGIGSLNLVNPNQQTDVVTNQAQLDIQLNPTGPLPPDKK